MNSTNSSKSNGKPTMGILQTPTSLPALAETGVDIAPSFEHDLIPRRRDQFGNRISSGGAYISPVSGSKDLESTELRHLLEEVATDDLVKAAYLRHLYADRLRPAFMRLQSVRCEVERELRELRERSLELDEQIDPLIEDHGNSRELALGPLYEKLEAALAELEQAHSHAAEQVALAGGSYDSDHPSEETVLRVDRLSNSEAANRLRLPWGDGANAFHLPKWVAWGITCLCGCLIGISLGIFAGFIEGLFDDIPMLLTWTVLDQGIAIAVRKAIGWSSFHFSESFYLGRSRCQQVSWFGAMLIVFGCLLLAAMSVDKEGILKLAQFQALESGLDQKPIPEFAMWCMAAVITLGYFIYALYDGLVHGRSDAIASAVSAEIEQDHRERSERRRELPEVKHALEAVNLAREHIRRVERCDSAWRAKADEFDQAIAKLEAQRVDFPEGLSEGQKHRVQDALDNLVGCQVEVDSVLAGVIGTSVRSGGRVSEPRTRKPRPGFWARVKRALRAR